MSTMQEKKAGIEIACDAFLKTLVGDAKLPAQHATNRDGILLLEELMSETMDNRLRVVRAAI